MPIVTRFDHADGVTLNNGAIAITANSRPVTPHKIEKDKQYQHAAKQCVEVAKLIRPTASIRIDIRRFTPDSEFALFDINMILNMTGPGHFGREN